MKIKDFFPDSFSKKIATFQELSFKDRLFKSAAIVGSVGFGILINITSNKVDDYFKEPDQRIIELKNNQDDGFSKIEGLIKKLETSASSENMKIIKEIKSTIIPLQASGDNSIERLKLAIEENKKLSNMLQDKKGILGGYDILLSENSAVRLDEGSVFGVKGIYQDAFNNIFLNASVSGKQSDKTENVKFRSGDSINYKNTQNRDCKVMIGDIRPGDKWGKGTMTASVYCEKAGE